MNITIMQPYFIPYAGYFRLFAASDIFVIYDDVQFPKEGWVNRNKLPDLNNEMSWLTLPLKKSPLNTKIYEKEFAENASERWHNLLQRFPILQGHQDHPLCGYISELKSTPVDFIVESLKITNQILGINCKLIGSRNMDYDRSLERQDRVIAIVKELGGTKYINSPGGKLLYDSKAFAAEGIELEFLEDYKGNNKSILYRLLTEKPADIKKEIEENI